MFNWHLKLQRLFQVLGRHLTKALPGFLQNLRGFGSPHKQLAVTCQTLHKQLTTADNSFQTKDKAWKTYAKALLLAQRCDSEALLRSADRSELIQVIVKFDPLFEEQVPDSSFPAKRILSVLLKAEPLTAQALDAA